MKLGENTNEFWKTLFDKKSTDFKRFFQADIQSKLYKGLDEQDSGVQEFQKAINLLKAINNGEVTIAKESLVKALSQPLV